MLQHRPNLSNFEKKQLQALISDTNDVLKSSM